MFRRIFRNADSDCNGSTVTGRIPGALPPPAETSIALRSRGRRAFVADDPQSATAPRDNNNNNNHNNYKINRNFDTKMCTRGRVRRTKTRSARPAAETFGGKVLRGPVLHRPSVRPRTGFARRIPRIPGRATGAPQR